MRRRTLGYYEPPVVEPPKKISIKFIDHTGNIIKEQLCDYGETIVYPTHIEYEYTYFLLIFDRWTHTETIAKYPMVIGAKYKVDTFINEDDAQSPIGFITYVTNVTDQDENLVLNINKASSSGELSYEIYVADMINEEQISYTKITRPTTSGVIKDYVNIPANTEVLVVIKIIKNTSLFNLGISTVQSGIFTDTDMTKIHPTKLYIGNDVRFFRNSLNDSMTWMEELILPDIGSPGSNEKAGVIRPLDQSSDSTLFVNATKLKALIVPSTYSLQYTIFNNCTNLKYIVTENTVREAFLRIANCPALEYIESTRLVGSLADNYLSGNLNSLKTVVLAPSVNIAQGTILGSSNSVEKLILLSTSLLSGSLYTYNVNNTKIFVPNILIDAYKSKWPMIANQIYKLSDITNV